MEALYSKLYNKYTAMKKEKESQFDKLNHEQEVKFLNYAAAADEMIEHLKSENDKLHEQVDELKNELASIRTSTDEQQTHFQKLLAQESQKNTELSEEILRLQKVEQEECSRCTTSKEIGDRLENSHDPPVEESEGISLGRSRKRRKSVHISEGTSVPYVDAECDCPSNQLVSRDKSIGGPTIDQPACCQRKISSSGGDATDTRSYSCMFHLFVEFVVGLKLTPLIESNELSIQANHQSSGYSFKLTWISNPNGDVELVYSPSSLGTFERVAPEWMKETLKFSTSMCRVFIDRVSRVINS